MVDRAIIGRSEERSTMPRRAQRAPIASISAKPPIWAAIVDTMFHPFSRACAHSTGAGRILCQRAEGVKSLV